MSKRWRVAVVGPGGVGGLIGAVLTRAGHDVGYVARPQTARALNADGMRVRSVQFGDFRTPAVAAPDLAGGFDVCLIAVKATNLPDALAAAPARMLGDALVVPLLNGFEHMRTLRAHYPAAQVVAGTIQVESTRVATGLIEHTSPFSRIDVASDTAPRERVEALAGQLRDAGFEATARVDETTVLWTKLALLAPIALLTTHCATPIGEVRERRWDDLIAVADEVVAVARAAGAVVDAAALHHRLRQVPAGMKSSMQRDAEAARPLELDAIGGAVLRAAQVHGLDTPVTARIVADLRDRHG